MKGRTSESFADGFTKWAIMAIVALDVPSLAVTLIDMWAHDGLLSDLGQVAMTVALIGTAMAATSIFMVRHGVFGSKS